MGGVWFQFMEGGGAKHRMIKYRLCRRYMIGRKRQGNIILKRFHAWGGGA